MTARSITDRALDINEEIERFASFDLPTRRFIAHAIWQVPELRPLVSENVGPGGNVPAPFDVGEAEARARDKAYANFAALRACAGRGKEGRPQRRQNFGLLLEPAWVDVHYRRIRSYPAFFFCYERLAGPAWRELFLLCLREAAIHRRRKSPPQTPLDYRLRDDNSVPDRLRDEPAPWYFPSMADADAIGEAPLLAGL